MKLIDDGSNSRQRMQRTWISLALDTLNLLLLVFLSSIEVVESIGIFRNRIVTVAVPAEELFFAWGPREVLVSARALLRVFLKVYLFLLSCHCPSYFSENSFSNFFRRSWAAFKLQEWGTKMQQKKPPPTSPTKGRWRLGAKVTPASRQRTTVDWMLQPCSCSSAPGGGKHGWVGKKSLRWDLCSLWKLTQRVRSEKGGGCQLFTKELSSWTKNPRGVGVGVLFWTRHN